MRLLGCRWASMSMCAVTAVLACACSSAARPVPSATPSTVALAGSPYSLYTHCGVREARIGHTYYLADHPLDDGQGNPPAGWGNPYQEGVITIPAPGIALFRDRLGHVVRFHARLGAKSFLQLCS